MFILARSLGQARTQPESEKAIGEKEEPEVHRHNRYIHSLDAAL